MILPPKLLTGAQLIHKASTWNDVANMLERDRRKLAFQSYTKSSKLGNAALSINLSRRVGFKLWTQTDIVRWAS